MSWSLKYSPLISDQPSRHLTPPPSSAVATRRRSPSATPLGLHKRGSSPHFNTNRKCRMEGSPVPFGRPAVQTQTWPQAMSRRVHHASQISRFGQWETLRSGLPSESALLRRACLDKSGKSRESHRRIKVSAMCKRWPSLSHRPPPPHQYNRGPKLSGRWQARAVDKKGGQLCLLQMHANLVCASAGTDETAHACRP